MRLTELQLQRFWSKVDRKGDNECWPWLASPQSSGYGQIKINGRNITAHRLSFMIAYDRDPGKCLVLHSCDNPLCVNPRHLCEGTHLENMEDRSMRQRAGKKLDATQVLAIRQEPGTLREIADRHGISHVTVGQIKRKQTWSQI